MRNRFLSVLAALASVAFAAIVLVTLMGAPQTGWSYSPTTVTEKQMMDTLKPASKEQAAALQQAAAKSKDPFLKEAVKQVYIAKSDVVIAATAKPMVIILPTPFKWTAGMAGNVVVVRTNGTTVDHLKSNYSFSDWLCEAQFLGIAGNVCNNVSARQPGDWDTMVSRMRRPTEDELKKWLGGNYNAGDTKHYYVATSDFIAAPQYTFDGEDKSNDLTLGIFMLPGAQVMGGQLGYMDLYRVPETGVTDASVTDMLCFMAGTPKTWTKETDPDHVGESNYGRTDSFAPKAEIERVSRCTR